MNKIEDKINIYLFFSNLVSIINLISLGNILIQEDTPLTLKIVIVLIYLILLIFGRKIQAVNDYGVMLFILDINLKVKQTLKDYKQKGNFTNKAMKILYFNIYCFLLYCNIEYLCVYAIGLVSIEVYCLIYLGENTLLIQQIVCISVHQIIQRFLFLQLDLYLFLKIVLVIYTISSAFLVVFFKTFEVFRFEEAVYFLFATYLGRSKPIFKDCKKIKKRILQEMCFRREGFVILFHLVSGIYIFEDLRYEFQILYLINIPLSFIKIFQYVKYLKEGPHKVVKKIDAKNIFDSVNKVKSQQYFFKFEFSQLTIEEKQNFLQNFIEVNPNTQFEYSQGSIQYLQYDEISFYYQMNPIDLESFKLQFKLFYSSKALYQKYFVLIQYQKCYELLGQFQTDKVIIKYPISALNYYLKTAGRGHIPSKLLRQYYSMIRKTILQGICFENQISQYIPINKNQLFYDLFDEFS